MNAKCPVTYPRPSAGYARMTDPPRAVAGARIAASGGPRVRHRVAKSFDDDLLASRGSPVASARPRVVDMLAFPRALLRRLGVELRRYTPEASDHARLAALLRSNRVDLVLDVGANTGQYARSLRALGYRGRIVSFEPLARAHAELVRAAAADALWTVAPRMALGPTRGELVLNVSENLVSSSPRAVAAITLEAAPAAREVGRETVPLERIDAAAGAYLEAGARTLLKLDVQGYEDAVLDGAGRLLDRLAGIQLELSLVALYEGQPLAWSLHERLAGLGFEPFAFLPGFSDPRSGRMLQMDGVYFRP